MPDGARRKEEEMEAQFMVRAVFDDTYAAGRMKDAIQILEGVSFESWDEEDLIEIVQAFTTDAEIALMLSRKFKASVFVRIA
jgi:hypothetical protein